MSTIGGESGDIDGEKLKQEANSYPELRFMTTYKRTATAPLTDLAVAAPWAISSKRVRASTLS